MSLFREVREHFALDVPLLLLLVLYFAFFLALVPRWTANAPMLAAFTNDEPFITQQLDGMTSPPYGNPSNFLEVKNADEIPAYWHQYRYYNLIYYGGTYLGAAFLPFVLLKGVGAHTFPTAPIILRSISFLAGLATLILLYNFARRHVTRFAALFAAAALMFEWNFIYMATTIHPDMLQLALVLLTLIIAVRHARLGDISSAIACGVLLGLIQGTKSGAPFVAPMVALAIIMGSRSATGVRSEPATARLKRFAIRSPAVAAAALATFVVSTPYALFDSYYLRTTASAYSLLSGTSPLIPITFATWYRDIERTLGWPLVIALIAGVAWFLVEGMSRRRVDPALTLALVLAASDVLWFTSVGRFWVVLYYLLAALGLLSIFGGALIGRLAAALRTPARLGPWPRRVLLTLIVVAVALGNQRPRLLAETVASGVNVDRTPQMQLANWAKTHVPSHSRMLFDDEAYFDPQRFPDQATNANVIRYVDLIKKQPDYFVLTDYPPASNWIAAKRQSQRLGRWDDDPYSVRLYQDLIDHSHTPYTPGPTPIRGIELVDVSDHGSPDEPAQPQWFKIFDRLYRLLRPNYVGLQSALSRSHRLLLYHVDPRFYNQRTPTGFVNPPATPIGSASVPGYGPANAFDGTGNAWLAQGQGSAADGAYIGVDYGNRRALVRAIRIKWVAEHWLPPKLLIQYSDDGQSWVTVIRRREVAPPDQHNSPGLKRWTEAIQLPAAGPHLMWRIVGLDVQASNYFGIDELELSR